MLGIQWHEWKHAMERYAENHGLTIPKGFNPKSDTCGKQCSILLHRIQHHAGLTQDGVLGPRTANLLKHSFSDSENRGRMDEVARWGIAHAASIHYAQIRPMNFDPNLPKSMDCSYFVTFCAYWANIPDPNGLHFSGNGNTSTLYSHLPRVGSAQECHVGDLVIWGGASLQSLSHVAVILEHGSSDPMLASHGSEIGPLELRLSAESPYHGGLARTFHRIV